MKPAVLILAGGEGRRIGGAKPLKMVGGERLVDRALSLARQWSDRVAIAVRDRSQLQANAELVVDSPDVEGPIAGLISGAVWARHCGCAFLVTIPADMPFLPDDLTERLAGALGDRNVGIASSGGQLHPVCGLWRVSALAEAHDYVAAGRRSLKGFAAEVGFTEVEWPSQPQDPFFNINMSEDLAEAERRVKA